MQIRDVVSWSGSMFRKRHPNAGARPGTLVIAEDAPTPRIRMISYSKQTIEEREIQDLDELATAHDADTVTWIDVQGFGDEQVIRELGRLFSLHPLVMEDVINVPQRPKAEAYDGQVLLIMRMVHKRGANHADMEQVSLVLGESYVLTFQERYGDVLDPIRERLRTGKGPLRRGRADFLTYTILDTIIDAYYPVLEAIGDYVEQMEDVVLQSPTAEVLRHLHRAKNMLTNLRRSIWPQREAVNSLLRDHHEAISDEVRLFLRDTYDHCVQTAEVAEMYREMISGLMNTYLSSVANRTNDVMKALTIMASIFIPLTFVAGIYGMNFEHMPELQVWWAYPLVWLTMISLVVAMLLFFRRKGWIGTTASLPSPKEVGGKGSDSASKA